MTKKKTPFMVLADELSSVGKPTCLRKMSLGDIEKMRKHCFDFLANSDKYTRIRMEQSIKSQLIKELVK